MSDFMIRVNDYKFAYLIQDILARAGLEPTGSGFALDEGWRDLFYNRFDIPENADFIPQAIEVNLPDVDGLN